MKVRFYRPKNGSRLRHVLRDDVHSIQRSCRPRSLRLNGRLSSSRRRGAAVLEFAVVAPLLFMMTMGLIEFGRTMMVQQILTNASREGARIGVVGDATTGDIVNLVEEYAADAFLDGVSVTVTPSPPSSAEFGEPVTVNVSVLFDEVSWLPAPWFLSGATLSATTSMRRESL